MYCTKISSLGRESIFSSHPETRVPIAKYKIQGAPLPSARIAIGIAQITSFPKKQKRKPSFWIASVNSMFLPISAYQASLRWHYPNQVLGRRSHLPLSLYTSSRLFSCEGIIHLFFQKIKRIFQNNEKNFPVHISNRSFGNE